MGKVRRWLVGDGYGIADGIVKEHAEGDWVSYEDYAALRNETIQRLDVAENKTGEVQRENAALRARLGAVREAWEVYQEALAGGEPDSMLVRLAYGNVCAALSGEEVCDG